MTRRALGAVVVLLVLAAGLALVGGLSPDAVLSSSSDGAPDAGSGSTTTTTEGDDDNYDFAIQHVENCGRTCRDVTARLANGGSEARENVRVTTTVYADGDLLWEGNETVGRLAGGEVHTSTKRVELGIAGGMAIQNNDGYVTIVTVVRSADGTARFEERREVG